MDQLVDELTALKNVELLHPLYAHQAKDFIDYLASTLGKEWSTRVGYELTTRGVVAWEDETVGQTTLKTKRDDVSSLELSLQFHQSTPEGSRGASCDARSEYDQNDVPVMKKFTFFTTPGYDLEELNPAEVGMMREAGEAMRRYKPAFP